MKKIIKSFLSLLVVAAMVSTSMIVLAEDSAVPVENSTPVSAEEITEASTEEGTETPAEEGTVTPAEEGTVTPAEAGTAAVTTPVTVESQVLAELPQTQTGEIEFNYMEYRDNSIHAADQWKMLKVDRPFVGSEYEIEVEIPSGQILYTDNVRVFGLKTTDILSDPSEYEEENGAIVLKSAKNGLRITVPQEKITVDYYTGVIPKLTVEGSSWFYADSSKRGMTQAPKSIPPLLYDPKEYKTGNIVTLNKSIPQYDGYKLEGITARVSYYSTNTPTYLGSKDVAVTDGYLYNVIKTSLLDDQYAPFDYAQLVVSYDYVKITDEPKDQDEPKVEPKEEDDPYNDTKTSGSSDSDDDDDSSFDSDSTRRIVTINEDPTPLAEAPKADLYTLVDEDVPLGNLPKTGGNSLMGFASATSAAGLLLYTIGKILKKEEQ